MAEAANFRARGKIWAGVELSVVSMELIRMSFEKENTESTEHG
jgi:hypothetical protein